MPSIRLRNAAWKSFVLAVVAVFGRSLWGQTTILPGSAAFDALPGALSAPRSLHADATFSTVRIADSASYSKPDATVAAKTDHSRRTWLLLAVASSGAAAFDAYTTRRAISHGAVELDPTLKSFANSNGLYAAIQVSPVILDFAAYKMQHSENPLIRRMWWVPQSIGTAVSLSAGVHNLGYTAR